MRQFVAGFMAALVLLAAVGFAYVKFGLAPVATASAPLPFEKQIATAELHARINREALKSSPIPPSEQVYLGGAQVYRNNCAVCHGLPDQDRPAFAKGEYPAPPQLFNGKGVTDDPVGVTYWKVANGIRLTGMPSFNVSLSSEQMWQVSLLLSDADKLPASVHTVLQKPLASTE